MRVLIDECIDVRFRNCLPGHDCQTASYAGLAGLKNGELLIAAETAKFDVFLTVDQGIEYQQNLTGRNIAIVILRAKSNRLADLLPHAAECVARISSVKPGGSHQSARRAKEPVVEHPELVTEGAGRIGPRGTPGG